MDATPRAAERRLSMSNLEHYFENLLFDGYDCKDEPNKRALTEEEQRAVEICADYIIYNIFADRDEFVSWWMIRHKR